MSYLSKYIRSNEDPNCFIKYRININNFNDYWCFDFSSIFKNYEFVIIEELHIPNLDLGKNLLQWFCDIMTTENKIIVLNLDDLELIRELYESDDYEDLEIDLLNFLDEIGFTEFFQLNRDFDGNVYFYTKSKLGRMLLIDLEYFYNEYIS